MTRANSLIITLALLLIAFITYTPQANAKVYTFNEGDKVRILAKDKRVKYWVNFTMPKVDGAKLTLEYEGGEQTWIRINQDENGDNIEGISISPVANEISYPNNKIKKAKAALNDWAQEESIVFIGEDPARYKMIAQGNGKSGSLWAMRAIPDIDHPGPEIMVVNQKLRRLNKPFKGWVSFYGYSMSLVALDANSARSIAKSLTFSTGN